MALDDLLDDEQAKIDAFAGEARRSLAQLSQEIDRELARLGDRIREAGGAIDASVGGSTSRFPSGDPFGPSIERGLAGTIGELSRGEFTGRSLSRSGLRLAGRTLGLGLAGVFGGGWRLSSLQSAAEQAGAIARSGNDL